jgi:transcriptional regulator with XRE-family HTH domain
MSDVVERILKLMKDMHLTAKQTAEMMDAAPSIISEWKNGRIKPSIDHIIKLSQIFNVSTDYILTGLERELPPEAQLTEGYDIEGNKVTISDEEADRVRKLINEELNKHVEEAVRKILAKEVSGTTDQKD